MGDLRLKGHSIGTAGDGDNKQAYSKQRLIPGEAVPRTWSRSCNPCSSYTTTCVPYPSTRAADSPVPSPVIAERGRRGVERTKTKTWEHLPITVTNASRRLCTTDSELLHCSKHATVLWLTKRTSLDSTSRNAAAQPERSRCIISRLSE